MKAIEMIQNEKQRETLKSYLSQGKQSAFHWYRLQLLEAMIAAYKQHDYSEQVEHDSDDLFDDLEPHTVKEVMKEIACEIIQTKRELAAADAVEEFLRNREIYGKELYGK